MHLKCLHSNRFLRNMEINFLFFLSQCIPHLVSIGTHTGIHNTTNVKNMGRPIL